MITNLVTLIIISYLFGSVPFGFLIAKAHGKDLRKIGSGNIGATNVARALGKNWAYFCFVLDVLKGTAPMFAARLVSGQTQPNITTLWLWLGIGCAAVLGHIFSIYLKFAGGKGVATSLGVVLGLYPYFTLSGVVAFSVWVVVVLIWRYISLASIIGASAFPIVFVIATALKANWRFAELWPLIIVSFIMPAIVVTRHAENIKRLLEGTEPKTLQKK